MKILLIQPNSRIHNIGWKDVGISEPLGLQTIAGTVTDHNVRILDMRFNNKLEKELISFHPKIVGVTCLMTKDVYIVYGILKRVKDFNAEIFTIVGGLHPTIMPQDFNKEYVNVIILGEGDESFREVINNYEKRGDLSNISGIAFRDNGRLIFTRRRKQIKDLDILPFPKKDITSKFSKRYYFLTHKNVASFSTSRGCTYKCNFCVVHKFFPKFTYMSPERVVEGLRNIKTKNIMFVDDNFFLNLERAEKIYELIKFYGIKKNYGIQARSDTVAKRPDIIKKWVEIGLKTILLGFETIKESFMKGLNKSNRIEHNIEAIRILHKFNVAIVGLFIMGPQFEKNDFDELANFILKYKICYPIITILTPFPGTDLYEEKQNQLLSTDYEKYDMLHAILPTKLPQEEFYRQMEKLYRKIYYSPKILIHRIIKARISINHLYSAYKMTKDVIQYSKYMQT